MNFRHAHIDDLPRIVEIYNSTIPSRMVTADTEPVSVESRIAWFHKHEPGKRPMWVATQGDDLIGWVALHSFYGRPAYNITAEVSIYVDQHFRQRGAGTDVLQFAIDQAKIIGVKNMIGYIFSHNAPSIALFRKFGFQEWGYLPDVAVLDGVERSLKIFGKRINT